MLREIAERLRWLEIREDIKIIYACESGSRAWGFASSDSDYDVRFIYARPLNWYLSIDLEHKRDVIEETAEPPLDINGWDLRKTLQLLRRSNPPLLEWLGSPIVYLEISSIVDKLRKWTPEYYSPKACLFHYWHMAKGNYRQYLQGESIWVKKYFYVLRPLLAIRWIELNLGVVPTEFGKLVEHTVDSAEIRAAIRGLVADKQQGDELKVGFKIPLLNDFIESELRRVESSDTVLDHRRELPPPENLNVLFRETLDELW